MKANGMEKDMMLACGEERREAIQGKVDGGNTHDVGDESGGAEGCDGGSGLVAKTDSDDR